MTELLLKAASGGDYEREALFSTVYPELRRIAARHMRNERQEHTLQPTALVNEAFLRLVAQERATYRDRVHFFATASELMRRILLDAARARMALKRRSNFAPISLSNVQASVFESPEGFVALNEALDRLRVLDERQARIVSMRFFGGLTETEIAEHEGISDRTVKRLWKSAKAYLWDQLNQ